MCVRNTQVFATSSFFYNHDFIKTIGYLTCDYFFIGNNKLFDISHNAVNKFRIYLKYTQCV